MTAFKYDTHVHTSEVSCCAKVSAVEAVKMYKDAGFHGLVITDHYCDSYFVSLGDLSWNQKIDRFLEGYNIALKVGKKLGLKIILGMEIRFLENANDYLVYGIDEKFLRDNKELYKLSLREFRKLTKKDNILIFQAHPFRPFMIPAPAELLDGVEVYNGNPRHNSNNDIAYEYALKNQLRMLSGSDFHRRDGVAAGGIIVSENISDSHEFADMIKNNKIIELIQ
ncbi:MAG: PHP domain-containing protein [Clostridiaceae bacterium]|jgi:predicted metal-dependent phosphoesterase TrpH|nr:PHP domain-containing protein [Clostridiaceae bacterium]